MRYILDDSGYIHSLSCNEFSCDSKECTEYTGTVPEGYTDLDEWVLNANVRAYKITDGNLVYDEARDAALQQQFINEEIGEVRITATNKAPNAPGTWQLIDKEFTPAKVWPFSRSSNLSSDSICVQRSGHTLYFVGYFKNAVAFTDNSQHIGNFNLSTIGVTTLEETIRFVGYSDGGNSMLQCTINTSGAFYKSDVEYNLTSVAAGNSWDFSCTMTMCDFNHMKDEACNKFYWKRIG